MITAALSIWVDCAGDGSNYDECHYSIGTETNPILDELSQDAYHTWIEQYGWLVVGDMAYCPVCRLQLHD